MTFKRFNTFNNIVGFMLLGLGSLTLIQGDITQALCLFTLSKVYWVHDDLEHLPGNR